MNRPEVGFVNGIILYEGLPARVIVRKDSVAINCTDINIDALKFVLDKHKEKFPPAAEYVIQDRVYAKGDLRNQL